MILRCLSRYLHYTATPEAVTAHLDKTAGRISNRVAAHRYSTYVHGAPSGADDS
jgi:hypothetical protein